VYNYFYLFRLKIVENTVCGKIILLLSGNEISKASKKDFKIQEKPPAHKREKNPALKKIMKFFVVVDHFGCPIRICRAD
jgi:hypothetical protein